MFIPIRWLLLTFPFFFMRLSPYFQSYISRYLPYPIHTKNRKSHTNIYHYPSYVIYQGYLPSPPYTLQYSLVHLIQETRYYSMNTVLLAEDRKDRKATKNDWWFSSFPFLSFLPSFIACPSSFFLILSRSLIHSLTFH